MEPAQPAGAAGTKGPEYTERLSERTWWKRLVDVQAPYRWNIRRLGLGRTVDIGCGVGRNLAHLGGSAVGVDHNETSVAEARARGFRAYTPDDFRAAPDWRDGSFDSLLLSHVAEHMTIAECIALIGAYVTLLRPRGRVVLITPQEAGQRCDATHVTFVDFGGQREIFSALDCVVEKQFSFPFVRAFGNAFPYNEFIGVGRRRT